MSVVLTSFQSILPKNQVTQEETIEILASLHTVANPSDHSRFKKLIQRFGCGPDRIATRYVEHSDLVEPDFHQRESFNLIKEESGPGVAERSKIFEKIVDRKFEEFYPENSSSIPDEIFHVTCTGYISPSGVQKVVNKNGWGEKTRTSHVYHMGCYAAVPAVRLASGQVLSEKSTHVDVVHTELCTLHVSPLNKKPEQLVVQSLFADGFIKYSVFHKDDFKNLEANGLEVLQNFEMVIPGTEKKMAWFLSDRNLEMVLSRDVPSLIAENIESYFRELFSRAKMDYDQDKDRTIFAIHPGGPRIIDEIQKTLNLRDDQVRHSKGVFKNRGNLSSATLPEIWKTIVEDDTVDKGLAVASVAFGPGLTVAGMLLRKV